MEHLIFHAQRQRQHIYCAETTTIIHNLMQGKTCYYYPLLLSDPKAWREREKNEAAKNVASFNKRYEKLIFFLS